jgi:hypothetical protein
LTETVDSATPLAPDTAEAKEHAEERGAARTPDHAEAEHRGGAHEHAGERDHAHEPDHAEAGTHAQAHDHGDERDDAGETDHAEAEGRERADEDEQSGSLSELLEKVGRDMTTLGVREAQVQAARNMPEVRRAVRTGVGLLTVVVALLAAFVFLNVAAFDGLTRVMAAWLAGLVLAGIWLLIAGVLLFGVLEGARRWLRWILFTSPPKEAMDELESRRDEAAATVQDTLERLGPAIAVQIATAAIPSAGDLAGDVAGGVVDAGDSLIEASDEIVEVITAELPGGGVVNQVWDVVLIPGRFGMRVATTVLGRGRSER